MINSMHFAEDLSLLFDEYLNVALNQASFQNACFSWVRVVQVF